MAEVAPVMGLAELMILGIDQDGGTHIIHSLLSVPIGPYDPDRKLFGYCREPPPKGLPAITNILVASFGALRAVNAV